MSWIPACAGMTVCLDAPVGAILKPNKGSIELPASQLQYGNNMKILVTGAAGFIGMHVARRLLEQGHEVVGLDNLGDYYAVTLKQDRLEQLAPYPGFRFVRMDLSDQSGIERLFAAEKFRRVVNLAAQPGVRYSLKNPHAYISSNIVGFLNVLEGCRHNEIEHLVFASSSSVYGANTHMPFSVRDNADHPVSLYAATKKSNELMAHSYSHLFRLPVTGLRLFTVYGPWGRPDMSPSLFAGAIAAGRPIDVFNHGRMERDFTYVDDIVEGVVRVLDQVAAPDPDFDTDRPDPACSNAPYRLYNIGNHEPVQLLAFIETLEQALGKKAVKNMLPMQAGDVLTTYADIEDLNRAVGFAPHTPLQTGVEKFVAWFRDYYHVGRGA
jgi:UDP-glucuronate 4-epimerase